MATKINTPVPYHEFATFSFTSDLIAPYKYQWKRDGVNLAHGNNKSYTTPPLRPEDFKAKYSVTVFGQDKIEESDAVAINANMTAPAPISNVAKAAASTVVSSPSIAAYNGPERRSYIVTAIPPKGMAERRKDWMVPKAHVPERRIRTGVSPTGVERRKL